MSNHDIIHENQVEMVELSDEDMETVAGGMEIYINAENFDDIYILNIEINIEINIENSRLSSPATPNGGKFFTKS